MGIRMRGICLFGAIILTPEISTNESDTMCGHIDGKGGTFGERALRCYGTMAFMINNKFQQRKRLRLKDFDYANTNSVYFITICAHAKQSYFNNANYAGIVADEIDYRSKTTQEVIVFAWCIMPDHVHILLKLSDGYGKSLQNWVAAFKRYTARIISQLYGIKLLWQPDFHEHVVRKEESLNQIAEYIANNPVRKGMVDEWTRYNFSRINFDVFG